MGSSPDNSKDQCSATHVDAVSDIEKAGQEYHDDYVAEETQQAAVQHRDDSEWLLAQKRYLRKLDFIILPTISLLYFFEYLDRGNIGNAKLYGLTSGHDTKGQGIGPGKRSLTSREFQLCVMIVYVGLITCQVPGCIGYRIFPPSKWIAFGVCGWAVSSLLQDAAFNLSGEMACRVFIGAFEGLFGTGIVYYLSLWYHRAELGVRVFWFLGPTAFSGAFGGLIAYGIGHIESSLPNWKWLFLIESLPCFCLGLFCLYWLPDRPMSNNRFKGVDQEIAELRYKNENFDRAGKMQLRHMWGPLKTWRTYAQVAIYFPTACCLASISGFLPSIVQGLGYHSPTTANLMTVPAYAVAFALMFVCSWVSDRYKTRGLPIALLMIVAGISYGLLATLPDSNQSGKYGCVILAVACIYATYPISHAWAANNLANETTRAIGLGSYTALGNFGSIAGSFLYPSSEGPQYAKSHYVCMGLSFATVVFALGNSYALHATNQYRDKKYGKPLKGVAVDVSELSDDSPHFRFIV